MNNRLTRIIIAAVVIIFIALGFISYIASRKPSVKTNEDTTKVGEFPSGGESAGGREREDLGGFGSKPFAPKKIGNLTQLTKSAVSGATIFGTSTIYYLDKPTGNVYKIKADGTESLRLTNTTILKSFEALWSSKPGKFAVRYFDEPLANSIKLSVKSLLGSLNNLEKATSTVELKSVPLPNGTIEVVSSPFEEKVFYIETDGDIGSGFITDFTGKNRKKIFELPFFEFNLNWPTKDKISLLTKPSYLADGYLYLLDQRNGDLKRILGNIKGLSASISPNGRKILYSQSVKNGLETKIFDMDKNTITDFGLKVLPDKCVWSVKNTNIIYCATSTSFPAGNYPDEWYQGMIDFDDSVWIKNITTGEVKILQDKFGADIGNLAIDANDQYLIFIDEKTGTLWSLSLN